MPKQLLKALPILSIILLSAQVFFVLAADITPPVTSVVQTPATPDGNNGWYISPVEFELTATDLESGVKEINYRIDGGAWQTEEFADSLNLAPNPSFETPAGTSSGVADWEATVTDGSGFYQYDPSTFYPGFASASEKITATDGPWHGINNQNVFSAASPFGNMAASAWFKTDNIVGDAYFKVFSVSQDGSGPISYVYLGESNRINGTNDWTYVNLDFVVNDADSIGVYIDIGIEGSGILWIDAVTISDALTSAVHNVTISTDGSDHTLEYYSVDVADNTEVYSCPTTNCSRVSIDQTPPGNWYNSGAIRGLGGSEHEVYVYTDVRDYTSGLSTNTDRYQYTVDSQPTFGYYENLIFCNTPWRVDEWRELLTYPTVDGVTETTLITPKTDFCNSNWKICKDVRFYAEDVAGNSTTKDFCINGPWIKFRGEAIVRANQNIDMLAESEEHNTDGLIEIGGGNINFFTSSRNFIARNSTPPRNSTFNEYLSKAGSYTTLAGPLQTGSDVYYVDGDYEIDNANVPNDYDDVIFNQVVFINGNLLISDNISIDDASTALFIVSGNVEIDKSVDVVGVGIITDQQFSTAYNITEGEATKTLDLNGTFVAEKFNFQRTLQGTGNQKDPSSNFTYEPKYLIQLQGYFGGYEIKWRSIE
jgi:hypothetical protein